MSSAMWPTATTLRLVRSRPSVIALPRPRRPPVTIATSVMAYSSLLGRSHRIVQVAGLVLGRVQHDLGRRVGELVHALALQAAELHPQHARMVPFAVGPELDVADHGLEGRGVHVFGDLVLVE